jgi:hypothetical protein
MAEHAVRAARPAGLPLLPAIEAAADEVFATHGDAARAGRPDAVMSI